MKKRVKELEFKIYSMAKKMLTDAFGDKNRIGADWGIDSWNVKLNADDTGLFICESGENEFEFVRKLNGDDDWVFERIMLKNAENIKELIKFAKDYEI